MATAARGLRDVLVDASQAALRGQEALSALRATFRCADPPAVVELKLPAIRGAERSAAAQHLVVSPLRQM